MVKILHQAWKKVHGKLFNIVGIVSVSGEVGAWDYL